MVYVHDKFSYRGYTASKTSTSACRRRSGLGDEGFRNDGKTSQKVTDLIDYCFGADR